jgi:beta-N-acetylhexosaminidase
MGLTRRTFLGASILSAVQIKPAATQQSTATNVSPLILGFRGTKPGDATVKEAIGHLEANRASGLIFFDRNIESRKQLTTLTGYIAKKLGNDKKLLSIDQEGGAVQRFNGRNGFAAIPSAQKIAQMPLHEAEKRYEVMSQAMRAAGLNFNFAPVVDVNLNINNPIIGRLGRSFSTEPDVVIEYARCFIAAHEKAGVGTCIKHFPGHGSSIADSHLTIADITDHWSEKIELLPYQKIAANAVMVGHLLHKEWSGPRAYPSSLSEIATNGLLRRDLGFKGAVFVDDLQMKAIGLRWKTEDAAVLALKAGADFVIVGNMLKYEHKIAERFERALQKALETGQLDGKAFQASSERRARLLASVAF